MARVYDCLTEYGTEIGKSPDLLSHVPVAVIAIWRYKFPVTYSRQNQQSIKNDDAATALRDEVLIICDDIESMQVNSSKNSHIGSLEADLHPSKNYLSEAFPGDWVIAWVVNGVEKARQLISDIKDGKKCNQPDSGIKFFGRATGMRKTIAVDQNGTKHAGYNLSANSGLEWDGSIYYEPYLEGQAQGIATDWLKKTGVVINNIIIDQKTTAGGGVSSMAIIPRLVDAFFGDGVPKNEGATATPGGVDTTAGLDSTGVFVVPNPVASCLGIASGSKKDGSVGINSITNILIGIQSYESSDSKDLATLLEPSNAQSFGSTGTNLRRKKCDDLLGLFTPSPPQFNGQRTVWQILGQFLNDAVNEMYLTLRVDYSGKVLPTLVVRQLPFSSGLISDEFRPERKKVVTLREATGQEPTAGRTFNEGGETDSSPIVSSDIQGTRQLKLTRFVELPRWQIPEILIQSINVGRNNALRFNFIHVYGSTGEETVKDRAAYIVRDPPVKDDVDIARNGLYMYPKTVSCSPADTQNGKAGDWMYILSDILMGQHLTLTGTMSCHGIYAPISVGDNVEYDQHIFHIESIAHIFRIDRSSGARTFRTTLALTHGVRAEQLEGEDLSLYSGVKKTDLVRNEGAHTTELTLQGQNETEEPSSSKNLKDPF